ncbi:MAG: response regulator transcription factor [Candidatus Saccharimonadales bacterium]
MKILFAENNHAVIKHIRTLLGREYVIDFTKSAVDTISQSLLAQYSLIILGLELTDTNNLAACKLIRKNNIKTPILVLLPKRTVQLIAQTLNSGADVCIPQPFHPAELTARVQALLRRQPFMYMDDIIQIGDLKIDSRQRQVQKNDIIVPLRRKEFDILLYLARNRGRTVSRAMIIDHVWEMERESWDGTVDVHIMHLRNKIDRPFSTNFIKTAYGLGYILSET